MGTLSLKGKESCIQKLGMWSNSEDMVLVNAILDLPCPDCTPPKLVKVSALCQKHITRSDLKTLYHTCWYIDLFNLRQVEMPILYIRNAKIWHANKRTCASLAF